MVARYTECRTRAQLRAVLVDREPDTTDPKLESHLEECAVCREELERLAAAPQWWEGVQSYLSGEHQIEERSLDRDETKRVPQSSATTPIASAEQRAQLTSWLP